MPDDDKKKHENEAAALLALFSDFIKSIKNRDNEWGALEELMKLRADFAIRHAFLGFGVSYENAIDLIRKSKELTDDQMVQRNILLAAVDNLVDFSVAEEYQLADEIIDSGLLDNLEEDSEDYDDLLEEVFGICNKYNSRYARVENMDIEYAMIVAAHLSNLKDDTELMYMTMGDERVRPWHLQYEGFTATRSQFPSWLIPPIEHQCRCYLVEQSSSSIISNVKAQVIPEMPDWFDKTFKESVANGGRIFSDDHPYFKIDSQHLDKLSAISKRIKDIYLNDGSKPNQ